MSKEKVEKTEYYYEFNGDVYVFNKYYSRYQGGTWAVSDKKAINNLKFAAKKHFGLLPNSNLTLKGELIKF